MAQATSIHQFFYWALHAGSLWVVLGDLLCFIVMTPLTAICCFYCAYMASKQALEGRIMGMISMVTLAGLLLTAHLRSLFFILRFHYRAFAYGRHRMRCENFGYGEARCRTMDNIECRMDSRPGHGKWWT
ncbi:hypothetical protein HPB51_028870 [Rhipicephalus microplus]|uniref:Uncharacterized protein n=1 Tax=Rhipicephalus microplus TaxID=6941 RepID=A0A9J6CW59_RHIMP|nr:hypothetical protein HPB51_028870 [Rhipicephalus microplus]